MLGAPRRCFASLSRKLPTPIVATRISLPSPTLDRTAFTRSRNLGSAWRIQAFHNGSSRWQNAAAEADFEHTDEAASNGSITKFHELSARRLVHDTVVRTITDEMRLDTMTPVQTMTIEEGLEGTDIIAQAKTGTGKTLGFLLPVLQNIIEVDPHLAERRPFGRTRNRTSAADIRAIIISPTRELAEQIAVEAKRLTKNTGVIVQTAVGGTQKRRALQDMQVDGCHLLVGTPGRLNDIFSDQYNGVEAPKLSALVLDEADRLLDAGFWPEINNFQRLLPDPSEQPRQTLMFSATVPREVVNLAERMLKPGFKFVQTVSEDEVPTIDRVAQHKVAVRGYENLIPTLLELAERETTRRREAKEKPFKAIVYFNSTAEVDLASSIIHQVGSGRQHPLAPASFFDIHARKTQSQRTWAADAFRRTPSAILFSSDVTARGMDFPNVTHVIQVGLPRDRETYIHRIGRTGRAGQEGEGWLFVTDIEAAEVRSKLRRLPIKDNTVLETAGIDMTRDAQVSPAVARILSMIGDANQRVDRFTKVKAYMALLGNSQWLPNKQRLIDAMNQWTKFGWGWEQPPAISPRLVSMLGLSRVEGIVVGHEDEQRPSGGRGGFGRDGGSGYGDRFGRDMTRQRSGSFDRRDRGGHGGPPGRDSYGGGYGGFARGPPGGRGSDSGSGRGFDRSRPSRSPF